MCVSFEKIYSNGAVEESFKFSKSRAKAGARSRDFPKSKIAKRCARLRFQKPSKSQIADRVPARASREVLKNSNKAKASQSPRNLNFRERARALEATRRAQFFRQIFSAEKSKIRRSRGIFPAVAPKIPSTGTRKFFRKISNPREREISRWRRSEAEFLGIFSKRFPKFLCKNPTLFSRQKIRFSL